MDAATIEDDLGGVDAIAKWIVAAKTLRNIENSSRSCFTSSNSSHEVIDPGLLDTYIKCTSATSSTPDCLLPVPATSTGPGQVSPTAKCVDGTYSYALHHQGACSYHGGVAVFYR